MFKPTVVHGLKVTAVSYIFFFKVKSFLLTSLICRSKIGLFLPFVHSTSPDCVCAGVCVCLVGLAVLAFCFHYMTNVTVFTCILNHRLILLRTFH